MKSVTVSVPGKVHFLGEHAVVYGKPALLASIDRRVVVSITEAQNQAITITSKQFSLTESLHHEELSEKTRKARESWEKFNKEKNIDYLTEITAFPLDYPFLAVGETLQFLQKVLPFGVDIQIDSTIPVGSGLGSSAAIAVAIAAAVSEMLDTKLTPLQLHQLVMKIEERKHGSSSGGDPATVLHGGLVWFRKESDHLKIIQSVPFTLDPIVAKNFFLVDSGKPVESTGEMVDAVRQIFMNDMHEIEKVFTDQEKLTRDLVMVIKYNEADNILRIIRQGQSNLEKLGVVPEGVKKIIRAIEESGGAAKISGGGGKTSGAGMVLGYHPDLAKASESLSQFGLELIPVTLGTEGLTIH